MSPYSQDLHDTRRLHTELASAWQQGRDYWALHPNEQPSVVQQDIDRYLVRTNLLPPTCPVQPQQQPEDEASVSPVHLPTTPNSKRRTFLRLGIIPIRRPSNTSLGSPSSSHSSFSSPSLRSARSFLSLSPTSPMSPSRLWNSRSSPSGSSARKHRESTATLPMATQTTPTPKQKARRSTVSGSEKSRVSSTRRKECQNKISSVADRLRPTDMIFPLAFQR